MSMRSYLQDHPALLVLSWEITSKVLIGLKPVFQRMGIARASKVVGPPEEAIKRFLFDCQQCGQCVLHYTGMTCPMTCPKNLRNGPCGGVRVDGKCEVKPDMDCVWLKAIERSPRTPYYKEIHRLNPPVDWRLQGLASWVTMPTGHDQVTTGSETTTRYATEAVTRET